MTPATKTKNRLHVTTLFPMALLALAAGCRDNTPATGPDGATGGSGIGGSGPTGAAGATGGAGGTAGAVGTDPVLDVSGRWTLHGFEDPVGVRIDQKGTAIAGDGCCTGFGPAPISCCGPVAGECVGRRATFTLSFQFGGDFQYGFGVVVSADGSRMAGMIDRNDEPVAWVRLRPQDAVPPPADPAVTAAFLRASGTSYKLQMTDTASPGPDFSPQRSYRFHISSDLGGDLGAFDASEATWDAATQVLAVGPVPETVPTLPVALRVQFDGRVVTTVEATMASGATYHFQATTNGIP